MIESMPSFTPDQAVAITTMATVASVVMSFVLATISYLQWLENKRLRKIGEEPNVVVYLTPHETHINIMLLVVVNVGTGPAKDIELSFEGQIEAYQKPTILADIEQKRRILTLLPQNEKYVTMFANVVESPPDVRELPNIHARIDYKNMRNKKFETFSELAIAEYKMARLTTHEEAVEKGLKNIFSGLTTIAKNLSLETKK